MATDRTSAIDGLAAPQVMLLADEFQYPFAAAPDIIRSNQKDIYMQGVLGEKMSNIMRELYGARFTHNHTSEIRMFTDLLYLGCTTVLGNRTLGEEYCDIMQVEVDALRLPSVSRRTSYVLSTTLVPYILTKVLPVVRRRLRLTFEQEPTSPSAGTSRIRHVMEWLRSYVLSNLSGLTSPAILYAFGLSIFYITGSYYHVGKRILRLRYIFTKRGEPSAQRIGYEVLGILLILQLVVQGVLHVKSAIRSGPSSLIYTKRIGSGVDVSLGPIVYEEEKSPPIDLGPSPGSSNDLVETRTHTPTILQPRYRLSDADMMSWMDGRQQRKCTLCLEELKDPSVTTCGHVYCWSCIADWIKEKPECPLCRQGLLSQHVLPLRG